VRQHITGPYPFDPNLVSQGIPIDDRVEGNDRIFGPMEGTPLPPGAVRGGTPPVSEPGAPAFPVGPPGPPVPGVPGAPPQPLIAPPAPPAPPVVLPPGQGPLLPNQAVPGAPGAVPVAPSAFSGNDSGGPSVASAQYNPQTGQYVTADGAMHQITNVSAGNGAKTWKDLLPM
jgi:hypothetical protein